MAWVRFPDGSRQKVGRVGRQDAEADLDELSALRDEGEVSCCTITPGRPWGTSGPVGHRAALRTPPR